MCAYKVCGFCVMDTSDPGIRFDGDRCNHCKSYFVKVDAQIIPTAQRDSLLAELVKNIKQSNSRVEYDCVVGISGGVDSSYVALLAKDLGLSALLVHLDNGWNSEISVKNVRNITLQTGFNLYTHVIDWNEFRDIQLALFKASVVDIELATDHAIKATLLKVAAKFGVKYILNGGNVITEAIMPVSWRHTKVDKANLKDIHRQFGTLSLKTYPTAGIIKQQLYKYVSKIRTVQILNYYDFDRDMVIQRLKDELSWMDYGGKHHESVFTRFYQAYILPKKFNIDKRRAHYSNLICAKQITRSNALKYLESPVYDKNLLEQDLNYVTKKLGFTLDEFNNYLAKPPRSHYEFKTDDHMIEKLLRFRNYFSDGKSTIKV
jgi:N-acetyl sugar amidotransferase